MKRRSPEWQGGTHPFGQPTASRDITMTSPEQPTSPPPPPVPSPAPQQPRRVRWAVWVAAVAVAVVAGYFGVHWWTDRLSRSVTQDAFVEAHIVNVAPEMVSGHIVRFLVVENDQVKQGQVLAEINPVPYRDQVNIARGKV